MIPKKFVVVFTIAMISAFFSPLAAAGKGSYSEGTPGATLRYCEGLSPFTKTCSAAWSTDASPQSWGCTWDDTPTTGTTGKIVGTVKASNDVKVYEFVCVVAAGGYVTAARPVDLGTGGRILLGDMTGYHYWGVFITTN